MIGGSYSRLAEPVLTNELAVNHSIDCGSEEWTLYDPEDTDSLASLTTPSYVTKYSSYSNMYPTSAEAGTRTLTWTFSFISYPTVTATINQDFAFAEC